jgi:hypothetical protein
VYLKVFPGFDAEWGVRRESAVMAAARGDSVEKSSHNRAPEELGVEMVQRACQQGLSLTGPDGQLKQLAKTLPEAALNEEGTERHVAVDDRAKLLKLSFRGCRTPGPESRMSGSGD